MKTRMKIALMTSQETWAGFFIQTWLSRLRVEGIEIGCVVLDENRMRRANPVSHMLSVAKQQSRVAKSSLPGALLRLVVFRLWLNLGRRGEAVIVADLHETIPSSRVAWLNSAE